jgi:hypothetical protein
MIYYNTIISDAQTSLPTLTMIFTRRLEFRHSSPAHQRNFFFRFRRYPRLTQRSERKGIASLKKSAKMEKIFLFFEIRLGPYVSGVTIDELAEHYRENY